MKQAQEDHQSPLSIFKALMIKQLRCIPSDRELYRRLWNDEALREICDIEEHEKPYHPSQLTRFRYKVGPERLEDIMNNRLRKLVDGDTIKGETLALDATFINAWSRRDPGDDSHGYSTSVIALYRPGVNHLISIPSSRTLGLVAFMISSFLPVYTCKD